MIKKSQEAIAAFKPNVDSAKTELAAISQEAIEKQTAAQSALIELGQLVSFSEKIAPIFAQRCLACHDTKTAKGRYNMNDFAAIVKGGESGAAVVPHDGDSSLLYTLIEDDSMPQDADPLTDEEKQIIKKWIETGAVLEARFEPKQPLIAVMPKMPQPAAPEAYRLPIPITTLAFDKDGQKLATSGYHEVLLYNAADGKIAHRFSNVAERVYDITFSPDGTKLAIAAGTPGQIGEAKVFDVASGKLLADPVRSGDSLFAVAYSPDGKKLATAGADRAVRVYDTTNYKEILLIEDHADWVMGLAWSPDGSKLATASRDKTSKVFDANTGDSLVTFNSHGQPVYGVSFSPDGKQAITGGRDKNIRVWNIADAKQVRAIGGFNDEIFRIVVTPEGQIFSASADKNARLHNLADGKALKTFSGHQEWVYAVAYHAGTKQLATGAYDGEVRLWNVDDAKSTSTFIAAPGYQPPAQTAAVEKK